MPDYWLDTDVFIQAKNDWYRPSFAPHFWEFLEEKAGEGVLAASSMVFDEMTEDGQEDELAEWVKARAGPPLFIEPDETVQSELRRVVNFVQITYAEYKSAEFLRGADPWSIAHALAKGGCVVSFEKLKQIPARIAQPLRVKTTIPNICKEFGIVCITLPEMLERLNAKL